MLKSDIKKLPENIRKNGFDYRLVKRNDERAIYSQHAGLGQIISYEVFKIKLGDQHKAKERWAKLKNEPFNPDDYEKSYEKFPTNEDFGKTAWTYPTLEQAMVAFESK
jgi:hypothetical protein